MGHICCGIKKLQCVPLVFDWLHFYDNIRRITQCLKFCLHHNLAGLINDYFLLHIFINSQVLKFEIVCHLILENAFLINL